MIGVQEGGGAEERRSGVDNLKVVTSSFLAGLLISWRSNYIHRHILTPTTAKDSHIEDPS